MQAFSPNQSVVTEIEAGKQDHSALNVISQLQTNPPSDPMEEKDVTSPSQFLDEKLQIGLICAGVALVLIIIAIIAYIVYRMRKKDEGSYPLNDQQLIQTSKGYHQAPPDEEFFA